MTHAPRTLALALALAALAGCSSTSERTDSTGAPAETTAQQPPAPGGDGGLDASVAAVTYAGFGPVRVGMTVAEAEQALGDSLRMLGPAMEPCHYVRLQAPKVAFMVIDGRIARVDVQPDSPVKTLEGIGVGDTEDRVRELYPGFIEVQPHQYTDGHYLVVRAPGDSTHRIVFETDGRRVTSFRGGRMPEVRWVEGCS